MRPAIVLLALLQLAAVGLFAAEAWLAAGDPGGTSPASGIASLAAALVLPLAVPALWLAARNRALPFAMVLVLVLPAAVAIWVVFF